jgi:predicted outer membrane protein
MKCVSLCLMVAAAAMVAASARAAAPHPAMFAPAAAAKAKRMSPQQREERQFLKDASAGSRFEAEAAHMAMNKSSDPGLRAFAATLINHHTIAGNELLRMLHARGMAPPMLGNDQRKTLNRLAKLQGSKFDREFMQEVGLRHQQDDIAVYEKAGLAAREPALRAWIARNLPTLRYHLARAERIAPVDTKLAKSTSTPAAPVRQAAAASRSDLAQAAATKSMGASPAMAVFGDGQLGPNPFGIAPAGAKPAAIMQLGVTQMPTAFRNP